MAAAQGGWKYIGEGLTRGPLVTVTASDAAVQVQAYHDEDDGSIRLKLNAAGELVRVEDLPELLAAIQAEADKAVAAWKR